MKVRCNNKYIYSVFPKDKTLEVEYVKYIAGEEFFKLKGFKCFHNTSDFKEVRF